MIPVMPFHTILKKNFCFIPLFLGRSPNLHPKSKRLNMARTARGSAQMSACCSSAPAASTRQLQDRSEGQTPTTSSLLFLWPSASSKRQTFQRQESLSQLPTCTAEPGALAQAHTCCWQTRETHHSSRQALVLSQKKKKHDFQLGSMTLLRYIKKSCLKNPQQNMAKWLTSFLPTAFDPVW